jgi:signal peptidase II
MTFSRRLILITVIVLTCVGCDQATKAAAKNYLVPSQPVSFLGDTFRLHYTINTGGFLSLGSKLPVALRFWLLTMMTGIFVAGALVFLLLRPGLRPAFVSGLSLIIGGGIGNLIDRMLNNGAVIDFMNIGIGSLRTGIFNIADVAIMAGGGMLIFFSFRHRSSLEKSF